MIVGQEKYLLRTSLDRELYKMSDIIRYNGRLVIKTENLAEHSYYVAMNIYKLAQMFNIEETIVNKAIKIALCHDLGEIFTGDLPHSIKVYSPEINSISKQLEIDIMKEQFPYFAEDFERYVTQKESLLTVLVETADCLDVLAYVDREEQLGNRSDEIAQIKAESSERYIKLIEKLKKLIEKEKQNE